MILPFKTKWPKEIASEIGPDTYFVDKILRGMLDYGLLSVYGRHRWWEEYLDQFSPKSTDVLRGKDPLSGSKITTIRADRNDRWHSGRKIDFFVNSRTKDMHRFAPSIPVVSTQLVFMTMIDDLLQISIEGRLITDNREMALIAINDGFPNLWAMTQFFFPNGDGSFTGKIIHWTSFQY